MPAIAIHSLHHLLTQRLYGEALGYDDLNEHDTLRLDPLLAVAGDNPRFLVTNLPRAGFHGEDRGRFTAAARYENFYCARGDMENMLKQQVLDLPGDRMSTHALAGNQLRLWLATLAYLRMDRLRRRVPARHRSGAGDGGDDPGAALESGGARDGERAAGGGEDEQRLAMAGTLWAVRAAAGGAALVVWVAGNTPACRKRPSPKPGLREKGC